jgi:hypothetical protein
MFFEKRIASNFKSAVTSKLLKKIIKPEEKKLFKTSVFIFLRHFPISFQVYPSFSNAFQPFTTDDKMVIANITVIQDFSSFVSSYFLHTSSFVSSIYRLLSILFRSLFTFSPKSLFVCRLDISIYPFYFFFLVVFDP